MEIKRGDKWSRLSYGKITDINGEDVTIENEDGKSWRISKDIFLAEFKVASSVGNTTEVTQTDIINVVLSKPGTIMTVNFNKKVDEKEVKQKLVDIHTARTFSEADAKRAAKTILQGEERTMIGRHYHQIDDMGRLQFIDMELAKDPSKEYDVRLRKVDPRTINWVIVENIKYIVK